VLNGPNLRVLLLGIQSKVIPCPKFTEDENLVGQAEKLDLPVRVYCVSCRDTN
jgi:hypothetical protein